MKTFREAKRFILHNLTEDDLYDLVALDSDPEVMHYINDKIAVSHEAMPTDAVASDFLPYVQSYNRDVNYGFWAMTTIYRINLFSKPNSSSYL